MLLCISKLFTQSSLNSQRREHLQASWDTSPWQQAAPTASQTLTPLTMSQGSQNVGVAEMPGGRHVCHLNTTTTTTAAARREAAATTEAETWLKFHGDAFSIIKINKNQKVPTISTINMQQHFRVAATVCVASCKKGGSSKVEQTTLNVALRRVAGDEKYLCDFHTIILQDLLGERNGNCNLLLLLLLPAPKAIFHSHLRTWNQQGLAGISA